MHLVLHVSLLKKCIGDLTLIVPLDNIGVKKSQSYKEVQVEILDRYICKLRNKDIALVKFIWKNQEATWEVEPNMTVQYRHLFPFSSIPMQDNSSSIVLYLNSCLSVILMSQHDYMFMKLV